MTGVAQNQSNLEELKQLLAVDEDSALYREWQFVLIKLDISLEVRNLCDEWFTKCHKLREEKGETSECGDGLFEDFKQHLYEQINYTSDQMKQWSLKDQLSKLQSYTLAEWIAKTRQCVVEEQKLIERYSKIYADRTKLKTEKPFELLCRKLEVKKMALGKLLEKLETKNQNCQNAKQLYHEIHQQFQVLQQQIGEVGNTRNGTATVIQQANTSVQDKREKMEQTVSEFQQTTSSITKNFEDIYEEAKKLIELLVEEVKQWQHEFKLKYAELAGNMDLDSFAPCCARTGELLRDLLRTDMTRLENAMNDVSRDGRSECDPLRTKFDDLLARFYQRTFIVTKQDGGLKKDAWNIRIKDKNPARTPQFTLRILAADTLESLGGKEINACFLLESRINKHYCGDRDVLDFDAMKREGWKIKTGKPPKFVETRSTRSGQHRTYEGTFSIELDANLNRTKNTKVYREKYRIVFWTQMGGKAYWTMSLPMVVTTGGNQNCQCLASITWQCFSTDVFNIPTKPLPTMPWSDVAEMLQAKIKSLPSNRTLTEDNVYHLKERLLGSAEVADDKHVSLEEFCSDMLPQELTANETDQKKEEFTFWMWYLSIYNLIKTYLLDFWKNGWIEGFLSKEMASRKLKESKTYKPGTLLLRFSDQHIDKSQGKDTVFGKLATCLLIKNSEQCQVVRHVDTIGHDKLADNHLADILLQTFNNTRQNVYRYLYPRPDTHCEILFQECQRKAQVPVAGHGYVGVRNVFQADLEELDEDFSKLELRGKRRLFTCPNSGDCKNNPEETQGDTDEMINFEVKRPKSNKSNTLPMEIDKSPIVVDKGNPIEAETGFVIGKTNMIGGETNMATGTNMAQDRTRMIGQNAIQTARLPGYQRLNTCNSSVLRKLLAEQPRATVNNASIVITQNKNNNFVSIENSEQLKNGTIQLTESGITENKGNNLATHSEMDQSNSESIQDSTISVHVSENADMSRDLWATIQNPDESQNTSPYDGETVNKIQPLRATIDGDQYDSLSLLGHERFMELSVHQSIDPNGIFEANRITISALDENQLVADPSLDQRSNENHSSDRLLDCLSGENLLSGGKGTFCSEPGGIQTQATNHQAIVPTANQYALSDEKLIESIQKNLMALPPEKAVDTLKPFLESLAPNLLLKIAPIKKNILEIITPSLKTLTPDLNQMVTQELQNSIEESLSHERPNQNDSNEEDSAATGLGLTELTPAELDDVLSVIESDILPNVETIYDFESQE